jgi:hypothetical protein
MKSRTIDDKSAGGLKMRRRSGARDRRSELTLARENDGSSDGGLSNTKDFLFQTGTKNSNGCRQKFGNKTRQDSEPGFRLMI